jgi:hypothetical protein
VVTTEVAAPSLRVTPRAMRAYFEQGKLQSVAESTGVRKTWLVKIDSLNTLHPQRIAAEGFLHELRESSAAQYRKQLCGDIRHLAGRLSECSAEARLQERLQRTEKADSMLREYLERERAGQLDQERRMAQEEARSLQEELRAERNREFSRRLFGA